MLFTEFCLQVQNVFHMFTCLIVQIILIKRGTSVCKRGLWVTVGVLCMEAVCMSNLHVEEKTFWFAEADLCPSSRGNHALQGVDVYCFHACFFIVTSGIRPSAVNQVCGRNGRVSNPAVHSGSRSVPEFTHTPWLQGGKISITIL